MKKNIALYSFIAVAVLAVLVGFKNNTNASHQYVTMVADPSGITIIDETGQVTRENAPKKTEVVVFMNSKLNEMGAKGYHLAGVSTDGVYTGRMHYIFEKGN